MEASALPAGLTRGRAPLSSAFLRLRSDEQLVAMFRAGSDDAFRAIHDRYRVRLLAYARQMLRGGSGDPEDALQDVFLRAYRALRVQQPAGDAAGMALSHRAQPLHRRVAPPGPVAGRARADAEPAFGGPLGANEPSGVAERSAALARLVADVQTLPGQQRSALLMRELQGLSYSELASALDVSVPAVKSLLLRARSGLIDAATARDAPCIEIRDELLAAADRSVRISGRARRHCSECASCEAYRVELRRVHSDFTALAPGGRSPISAMLLGLGGGGGAAAAGGGGGGWRRRRRSQRDRREDRRRRVLRRAARGRRPRPARAAPSAAVRRRRRAAGPRGLGRGPGARARRRAPPIGRTAA